MPESVQKEFVIIVAGGKGTRAKSTLPKQFMPLNGKPVILHTVEAFIRYSKKIAIILVLPEDDFDKWEAIRLDYNFTYPVMLQAGGITRFRSVKNGLSKIQEGGLVAIHDGVRPLVTTEIISASFRLAAIHKTAIASVSMTESIRMTDEGTSSAVDRSRFRLIQTPQTFDVRLIQEAYSGNEDAQLTDDASVAEQAGNKISLFEGSYSNLKITTPEDFAVASALLSDREKTKG